MPLRSFNLFLAQYPVRRDLEPGLREDTIDQILKFLNNNHSVYFDDVTEGEQPLTVVEARLHLADYHSEDEELLSEAHDILDNLFNKWLQECIYQTLWSRPGHFQVSLRALEQDPKMVQRILATVIVLRAEHDFMGNVIKYWAISDHFMVREDINERPFKYKPAEINGEIRWEIVDD